MERTTYTLQSDATHYTPELVDLKEMFPDKYIFVFQEIRGRYSSEGQFVMFRPPRDLSDPKAIDETTDAYDTIDWLVKNVPNNNGAVGLLGVSYNGWLATMALLDPHPPSKQFPNRVRRRTSFWETTFIATALSASVMGSNSPRRENPRERVLLSPLTKTICSTGISPSARSRISMHSTFMATCQRGMSSSPIQTMTNSGSPGRCTGISRT